jgi:hypothetical protein
MAEFKLGRIRFVWKNQWTGSSQYFQDDVVAHEGKVYICVIGHTSSADFFTDFDISPPKWNLVSDGQTWKGEWQPGIEYFVDNIVGYGGRLYIAQTKHTSAADSTTGLEADIGNWQIYAEGVEWKGDWQTSFDYKENDQVKYGGTTYVCNQNHISAASIGLGLEADQSNWDIFNQGFDYKGDWQATFRYKLNDVVRLGANLWIVTTYHTSQATFAADSAKWSKFVDGFQYESRWSGGAQYQPGDIVAYGGNQYIAKTENTGARPPASTSDWDLFSEGLRFIGDWGDDSTNFEYEIGDLVRLGGFTYRAKVDHQGQQPPNTTYWQQFNAGLDWRGQWLDDQEYYKGDVVRYGDNSYVCVQGHFSEGDDFSTDRLVDGGAQNSRPDQDITGTYWNAIAIGSEQSVLTTAGDLVYYSEGGPTRLPIGVDGQILQVGTTGLPEWTTYASADDVYYVAEHGVDAPAPSYGKSIDRPWRSIRYAAQQIELGTKASSAVRLLELNRRFIQREIVEWTDYQIANNTSPFTTSFVYDSSKCERDMGLLIDAFVHDLKHGGNVKSREAALRYVQAPGNFYILGQEAETNASIAYGLTLIEKVLKQVAPAVNYQTENGDNSTAIVGQYFESALGDQAVKEYESVVSGGGAVAIGQGTPVGGGGSGSGGGGGGGY